MAETTGVVVPAVPESGRRSTSALGRTVVAGALTATDPAGARAAQRETDWRRGYPVHFKRMVEVGFDNEAAAVRIARDGLATLHEQMRYRDAADSSDSPLADVFDRDVPDPLVTSLVEGRNQPESEFSLPYKGERLRGDDVRRQLDAWVRAGAMEHRPPMPCVRCSIIPSGSRCRAARWSRSARPRRWGRCRRCCDGARPSPPSIFRDPSCGGGSSISPDRAADG